MKTSFRSLSEKSRWGFAESRHKNLWLFLPTSATECCFSMSRSPCARLSSPLIGTTAMKFGAENITEHYIDFPNITVAETEASAFFFFLSFALFNSWVKWSTVIQFKQHYVKLKPRMLLNSQCHVLLRQVTLPRLPKVKNRQKPWALCCVIERISATVFFFCYVERWINKRANEAMGAKLKRNKLIMMMNSTVINEVKVKR